MIDAHNNLNEINPKCYPISKDEAIIIIDNLFSSGWTSYYDIYVEIDKYCKEHGINYNPKNEPESILYYTMQNRIRSEYIPHFSTIYSTVHLESPSQKVSVRNLFIKRLSVSRKNGTITDKDGNVLIIQDNGTITDKSGNVIDHILRESTLSFLINGPVHLPDFDIFEYTEKGFSLLDDMELYNSIVKAQQSSGFKRNTPKSNKVKEAGTSKSKSRKNKGDTVSTADLIKEEVNKSIQESLKSSLDPEIVSIQSLASAYKNLWGKLKTNTEKEISKRTKEIETLLKTKPSAWEKTISDEYSKVFSIGLGIIDDAVYGLLALQYGSYLIDTKDYIKARTFLEDALVVIKESLLTGNNKAKEKYALILQNLVRINTFLRQFDLAEDEANESLGIFRELSKVDGTYEYGIPALLCSLAEIHMEQRLFEEVEKEYKEAIGVFSKLSESDPAKYSYYLMECLCSIGHYYMLVRKMDESVSAFEQAIPFFDNITEENYTRLAPQKAKVLINYSSTLTSVGDYERSKRFLQEAIHILNRLNEKSVKDYDEELSTAYHNLGTLYNSIGNLQESLDNLNKAEDLRRTLALANPEAYNFYLSDTLHNQATVISRMPDNNEEDIKKWQEAISLLKAYENRSVTEYSIKAGNYNLAMGVRCLKIGKDDLGLSCLLDAEKSFRTVSDRNSSPKMFEDAFIMTLALLGDIYSQDSEVDFTQAELKYKEAIELGNWYCYSSEEVDISPLIFSYAEYGIALHDIGRYKESIAVLTSAIELFEQKKDRVANFDFINSRIFFASALRDDCGCRINNSTQESGVCSTDAITPSEALSKVISIFDDILNLDKNDFDYRDKCHALYSIIVEYENLLDNTLELANVLSSYCKFLFEEYGFFEMTKYAPRALKIFKDFIAQDDKNFEIKRKYIELLRIHCVGLVELGSSTELKHSIEDAEEILGLDIDDVDNDATETYLALKREFSIDFLISSSKDSFEKSQQLLEGYRHVSSPEIPLMLRFLYKAALYACDFNKWEIAERYINEAETLMNGREFSCLEERSILGEIYALKGKYLMSTQLKDSKNYAQYSYDKSLSAYNKAKEILIDGLPFSPVLFKSQLLDLDRAVLHWLNEVKSVALFEMRDLIVEILRLSNELREVNPELFIWRSVEAHLDAEEVWQELCFSQSKTKDELTDFYKNRLPVYDYVASQVSYYLTSRPDYYSKYSLAIDDAKKRLKSRYFSKMEEFK